MDWEQEIVLEAGQGRTAARRPALVGGLRMKAHFEAMTEGMLLGICLYVAGAEHRIEMNPGAGLVSIARPGGKLAVWKRS